MNKPESLSEDEIYITGFAKLCCEPSKRDFLRIVQERYDREQSDDWVESEEEFHDFWHNKSKAEDVDFYHRYISRGNLYRDLEKLTPAEAQVVVLYRRNPLLTDKEIAAKLGKNEETVTKQMNSARKKLGARERIDLLPLHGY